MKFKKLAKPKKIAKSKKLTKPKKFVKSKKLAKPKKLVKPTKGTKIKKFDRDKKLAKSKKFVKGKKLAKPKRLVKPKKITKIKKFNRDKKLAKSRKFVKSLATARQVKKLVTSMKVHKAKVKSSSISGKTMNLEVEQFEKLLLKKKTELENRMSDMEEKLRHSQQDSAGDLSSYPMHMGDIGSDTEQREQSVYFVESIAKELRRINRALEKMASGEYGICEHCGKKITSERLKVLPYAECCLQCGKTL